MKLAARVGTSGIDGELGLSRRFSPTSVVYAGTVLGYTSGTQFKLRYSRAGQVRECYVKASLWVELGHVTECRYSWGWLLAPISGCLFMVFSVPRDGESAAGMCGASCS